MNRKGHRVEFRIYQKALCLLTPFFYITHKGDLFDSAWTADTYCRQIFP
jgi:hypothetical protein